MKLTEIPIGGRVSLSVKINGKILQFAAKVAVILPDSILVETVKENDKSVGFGNNKVQVVYAGPKVEKPVVWLQNRVLFVKYKGEKYHQIIPESNGRFFNRRDGIRLPVNIAGTATGREYQYNITVRDISDNGISFFSDAQLPMNSTIRLNFSDAGYNFNLSVGICWYSSEENSSRYIYGCSIFTKNVNIERYIEKKQAEQVQA